MVARRTAMSVTVATITDFGAECLLVLEKRTAGKAEGHVGGAEPPIRETTGGLLLTPNMLSRLTTTDYHYYYKCILTVSNMILTLLV